MIGRRSAPLSRATYVALALGTIALGLIVHLRGAVLGAVPRDVLGDALWAVMIAWWIGALAPRAGLSARSAVALAICAAVETSQLYHAPTIDAVRRTRLGSLVLGSGFDPRDLVAYAVGIGVAVMLESMVASHGTRLRAAG